VWRFSLYYVVVFGAYVALSAWLPNYYRTTYGVNLRTAALLTAAFIFPASLLRPLGGWLSDHYGPRTVTYAVFVGMTLATIPLCVLPLNLALFTTLMVAVGVGMGVGKASVYKYIPNYFPKDVGAVGGLVGLLGALGGFVLPPVFGWLGRATGSPQAAFYALLALTVGSLVWLHLTVIRMKAAERFPDSGTGWWRRGRRATVISTAPSGE
jgi:NNP family nitrate/nitrite transporter-like MFS transporter